MTFEKKNDKAKEKAFFLFGEHAREMISAELGLAFIQELCSRQKKYNGISS